MGLKSLYVLIFFLPTILVADWSEDPFVYKVESTAPKAKIVKTEKPEKKLKNSNRVPASVSNKSSNDSQDFMNLNNTNSAKKFKVAPIKAQAKDQRWERVKKNFERSPASPNLESKEASTKKSKHHFSNSFKTGFVDINSESVYFPRAVDFFSPSLSVSSRLFLSDRSSGFISYSTSINAAIPDKANSSSFVEATYSALEISYRWRQSVNSSIAFEVGLSERSLQVDKVATQKLSVKNEAVFLGVTNLSVQGSANKFSLAMRIYPVVSVTEESTAWANKSGSSETTVAAELKAKYRMSESRSWDLNLFFDYYNELSQFKGSTAAADPETGLSIDRLKVQSSVKNYGLELIWKF